MSVWDPVVREELQLEREPENMEDQRAVAVKKNGQVVGHMPRNIAPAVFHFLARPCNAGVVEITGHKVNRGAGYSLEVPCIYRFYDPESYLRRLKKILASLDLS